MTVDIDPLSGFCYGVVRAIQMAEDALTHHQVIYSLGDIVHNEEEVSRLSSLGLQVIHRDTFEKLKNVPVLIRAHGEPPSSYQIASQNGLSLIDATCPVVLNLQKKVHLAYQKSAQDHGQIVIYGKSGHAEVNGLVGQTENHAIVIENDHDLSKLDIHRPIYLFAQTTQPIQGLKAISQHILDLRAQANISEDVVFHVNDTVCRQVANREPKLIEFSHSHDVIIFVGGLKSSNGKVLFEVCRSVNPRTYFVSRLDDVQDQWFVGVSSVGICGATSTPHWLMKKIETYILKNSPFFTQKQPLQ